MPSQCDPCLPACTPPPCGPKELPKCGTVERCAMCHCSKIDARVCLPCKCRFCASCVEKLLPPDCPTMTACPICTCDAERLKAIRCPDPCKAFDPCGEKGLCYRSTPPPCDEWFCFNCFTEGCCKVRAKEFCLDCDVSMCEKHIQQHKAFIKKKKHNMLPVCQYKLMKRKFECRRCPLHPKHTLLFVCQKCDKILCQVCVACGECECGGRHDAQELETVAMEMASSINQSMKDVDCVKRQGEKVIEEGFKVYQRNECELEKLKQAICCGFEEKNAELCREKQCILSRINEMICQNKKATHAHKNKIQNILCESKNVTARANQLLQYTHNVDIASGAKCMLNDLNTVRTTVFPCLELGKFKLCKQEKPIAMPSIAQDCDTKTTFCPQPSIPAPPSEDQCAPCSRPRSPCSPCPPCNPCNPCAPPPCPTSPCNPCAPPCNPCAPPPCNPCNPCSPCPDPCDPCNPCNPCRPKPCDPCDPCYDPCNPCNPCYPCNPCAPKCPPPPCGPCPPACQTETTFRYEITDASCLTTSYSQPFWLRELPWNIMAEIRQVKKCDLECSEYLAFFLQCNKDSCDNCWCCEANAELRLVNQVCPSNTFSRKICHRFCPEEKDWGFSTYIKWCDVLDPCNGFFKNGSIVLEVHVQAQPKDCRV